ncbi:MAG: hypothetical protein GY913_10135 [Proteobacteria bacterium]|nr:hypothetical protein [Pseudomonadota bacterium]MCP4917272.1 hypothetical protein [Pseudomonadota bacterium]
MTVLISIVAVFLLLESANVCALYFRPGSDKFNALGVFKAWEASKQHPELHDLIRYLAYWVAGAKLIVLMLLVVILVFGDAQTKVVSVAALIVSILSFFWRLFPLIRRLDERGQLTIPGYSKVLGLMIAGFLAGLGVALGFGVSGL